MFQPPGFPTVVPYLFVDDAPRLLQFLQQGLAAQLLSVHERDGRIANAQLRIGDSILMVSEASPTYPAMPASYYLYVPDADAAVAQAVAAGASLIMAVADMPYQDRQGGVRDVAGNLWWISQHLGNGYAD